MKKKNLALIISAVSLIVIGIVLAIILNVIQGIDFWVLLSSKWSITIIIFICLYCLIVAIVVIKDWVSKL